MDALLLHSGLQQKQRLKALDAAAAAAAAAAPPL